MKNELTHSSETQKESTKKMKTSKFLPLLTAFAAFFGIAGAALAGLSSEPTRVFAQEPKLANETSVTLPENETQVDPESLYVSLTSSSTTEKSHSFGARFSSSIKAYGNGARYKNLYFVVNDSSFVSEEESSASKDENGAVIGELPEYNADLYTMFGTSKAFKNVVIPSLITLSEKFSLKITGIVGGCTPGNAGSANQKNVYTNVESIIIPNHIEKIEEHAFMKVPDTITIKCEAASKPEGWSDEWTDAKNVEWGYSLSASQEKDLEQSSGTRKEFGTGANYIVGSYLPGEYRKPLVVTYDTLDKDGKKVSENKAYEIPLKSSNASYDEVGSGQTTFDFSFDLEKNKDEEIDVDSIVFHNIYNATRVTIDGTNTQAPDIEGEAYYAKPTIAYKRVLDISDLIKFRTTKASSYAGYVDFNFSVDKIPGVYQELMPNMYKTNEEKIASGAQEIRTLIFSVNTCYYRISFQKDGELMTLTSKINSPVDFVILTSEKNNAVGYSLALDSMSEGLSFDDIVSVDLIGLTIKLDIYNKDTSKSVTKSSVLTRFGVVDLYDKDMAGVNYTSIEAMVGIWFGAYAACFIAGAVAYYFYCKNRYKNDEFRRVNLKRYLKETGKNFLGFGIIVLALIYNVARWSFLQTTVVAYNPLDAYLIVFTVLGAIFLGFFIKGVVNSVKDAMKRKEALRLKLDQDASDDGTN